jgi:hypothetical protein
MTILTNFFGKTAHPHNWTEQAKITKCPMTFLSLVYSLAESMARNSLQLLMTVPPFSYLLDEGFMEENFTEKNITMTDPESDIDFSETGLFDEDMEPPVIQSGSKLFTVYKTDSTTQVDKLKIYNIYNIIIVFVCNCNIRLHFYGV